MKNEPVFSRQAFTQEKRLDLMQTRNNYDLGVMNGAVGFVSVIEDAYGGFVVQRSG